MINPNLDIQALVKSLEVDKRLQINNFIQLDTAERLHNIGKKSVPFDIQYVLDGKYQSKTPAEMANLNPQEAQQINNKVSAAASQGVGFLYEGYLKSRVKSNPEGEISEELKFLHEIFDYLGSNDVLEQIKHITGDKDINGAEAQYSRFTSGHFLTRHLDVVPGRGRRYAFVLGLTKNWHPDWGGLLQFYEKDGTPRDAWMPQFNVLSIFDVSHIHAVTYVTPYATEPRLSISGWFVARE